MSTSRKHLFYRLDLPKNDRNCVTYLIYETFALNDFYWNQH